MDSKVNYFVSASLYSPRIEKPLGLTGWMTIHDGIDNMMDMLDDINLRGCVLKFSFSAASYQKDIDQLEKFKEYKNAISLEDFRAKRETMLLEADHTDGALRYRRFVL